jgi:hypothetical protein
MKVNIIDLQFYPDEDERSLCIETFPCYHVVKVTYENGKEKEESWESLDIYREMVRLGKESKIPGHIREDWEEVKQLQQFR